MPSHGSVKKLSDKGFGRAELLWFWSRFGIWMVLVIEFIIALILAPQMRQLEPLLNVTLQIAVKGILALGMTFAILSAGIDLSVGAVMALSGCIAAGLIKFHSAPFSITIIGALLTGAILGAINGVIIAKGKLQPFIVTLSMMIAARGVAYLYTDGQPVILSPTIQPPAFRAIAWDNIFGIFPIGGLLFIILALFSAFILQRTRFGRYVFAIGGNEEAVRLSGVNVARQKILVYTLCGLFSAIAALVAVSRQSMANYDMGMGYELDAIAAVVIGGTSLMGGVGGLGGTVAGAFLLGILSKLLNIKGVEDAVQQILKGLIIVSAAFMAQRRD